MSRADQRRVPAGPRVGAALRAATTDLYYNSWRFLGANMLVGALLVVVLLASVGSVIAVALLVVVVVPSAGMMRMATTLVREGHTDFGEVWALMRRPWTVLGLGALQVVFGVVLVVDVIIGVALGSVLGTFLAVSAIYGIVVGWAVAMTAWPLLLDPVRDGDPVSRRLRLAATLLLAHPLRMGGMALALAVLLLAAGLAVMPLVTIAMAFVWLVAARYVLPAADRLEGRSTEVED